MDAATAGGLMIRVRPTMAETGWGVPYRRRLLMGQPSPDLRRMNCRRNQAATGVNATVIEVRVRVSVLAHAFDADRAPDRMKFPAVEASHREMWLIVSDVPPFVQTGAVPVPAFDPADAAAKPCATRVVDPAAALLAPAEPGSPVCSLM